MEVVGVGYRPATRVVWVRGKVAAIQNQIWMAQQMY